MTALERRGITPDEREQLREALAHVDRLYSAICPWLQQHGEGELHMLLDDSHRSLMAAGYVLQRQRHAALSASPMPHEP
jgi:hypothetical protein